MSNNYNEYCMKFSNEEIEKYLISSILEKGIDKSKIRRLSEDGEELDENSIETIETIVFDGDDENLFITFYGIHTSIFVKDYEIMFIDEKSKGVYTESDVYNNVIYAGNLRELTHEEILDMFVKIVDYFCNADEIIIEQGEISKNEQYVITRYIIPHEYVIKVKNNRKEVEKVVYANISINVNV